MIHEVAAELPEEERENGNVPGQESKVIITVIPTYNEHDNLEELLGTLFHLNLPDFHVIVVDDNSPDGTGKLAEDLSCQYSNRISVIHRAGKMGFGSAYVEGFKQALQKGANIVIQMDGDISHRPEYVPQLIEPLGEYDVVIGSRYVKGGNIDSSWGLMRRIISRGANTYIRWVTRLRIKDATGGFRSFTRRGLELVDLDSFRSKGFVFQVEMVIKCQRKGLKMLEIPISFYARRKGKSKLDWRIIQESMIQVWRLRSRNPS